jgi:hypothetical protein
MKLELRARHLREALNHYQHPGKAYELNELTKQWLAAGREITERLFALIPKPNSEEERNAAMPVRSYYGDDQGRDYDKVDMSFLDGVARNEDGEAVDDEGNILLPDPPSMREVLGTIAREAELAKGRAGLRVGTSGERR